MKKLIAAMFVAMVLCITVLPAADQDGAGVETVRWSDATLMHATVESIYDIYVSDIGVWVYEQGKDSSMKSFIDNYRTADAPVSQIGHCDEGKKYEIYYLTTAYSPLKDFRIISGPEPVLNPYTYDIYVEEKSQVTLTLNKFMTPDINGVTIRDISAEESRYITYLYEGDSAKLSYLGEGHHYTFERTTQNQLFIEVQISMETKTFTGSAELYIGLSTAVVVLVGLTMFLCGRKPKL